MKIADIALEMSQIDLVIDKNASRTWRATSQFPDESDNILRGLQFGGPLAAKLTPEYADTDRELALFLEQEMSTHRYTLLRAGVTFNTIRKVPILETVTITYRLAGSCPADQPIAWSLNPMSDGAIRRLHSSFELTPRAKIANVEVNAISVSRREELEGVDASVEASGLLTPNPAWHFKKTKLRELRGSYDLLAIIRSPASSVSRLVVTFHANAGPALFRRRLRSPVTNTSESEGITF